MAKLLLKYGQRGKIFRPNVFSLENIKKIEQTTFYVSVQEQSDAKNISFCSVKHFTEYNIYCSL